MKTSQVPEFFEKGFETIMGKLRNTRDLVRNPMTL
jgi:hypothetical protein